MTIFRDQTPRVHKEANATYQKQKDAEGDEFVQKITYMNELTNRRTTLRSTAAIPCGEAEGKSGRMWRATLFTGVLFAGTLLLETLGFLPREKALLVAWIIAALLLFCIPESEKTRDLKGLIFSLLVMMGTYLSIFKFRPWLAVQVGQPLAVVLSILLVLAFGGALLMLPAFRRTTTPAQNA